MLHAVTKHGHTYDQPQLRGIAIAPLLCRLYDTIMDNRFRCWYVPNAEQAGFRPKQGCLLPLFSLTILIVFCKEHFKNLFVGFLDFEKAFDYVNRAKLLIDLMAKGCGKSYVSALSKMYVESFYAPKINRNQLGDNICTRYGVTQGRRTSTNLFSFFVSDMHNALLRLDTHDFLDPFNLIQLADDTAILAEFYESLRIKFSALFSYSDTKYQVANSKKTFFAHFSSKPITNPMIIKDNISISSIDEKKGHVYLGMTFLPTDDLQKIVLYNINNRMKHVAKYYAWLEVNQNTPIETKLLVLDNCMFSAILYGCEVWGDVSYLNAKVSAIEIQILKRILNVNKGTCNDIIFFELKRPNIVSKIMDRQYVFFQKLFSLSEDDTVILKLISLCKQSSILDYYFNLQGNNCSIFLTALEHKIQLDNSSMISYYRNLIKPEKSCIYQAFVNDYYRRIITRWRLSNHQLKIETGRYARPYVPREARRCVFCNLLEDEDHVIFVCPIYQPIRVKYTRLLTDNNSISMILNPNNNMVVDVAKLLYDIEALRDKLKI